MQISAVGACFKLTPLFVEVTITLQGRDEMEPLLSTGLDDHWTEIIAVEKDPHMDAFRGVAFGNQFCRHLGDLFEGLLQVFTMLFLEIEAYPKGDGISLKEDRRHQKLMAFDGSAG